MSGAKTGCGSSLKKQKIYFFEGQHESLCRTYEAKAAIFDFEAFGREKSKLFTVVSF